MNIFSQMIATGLIRIPEQMLAKEINNRFDNKSEDFQAYVKEIIPDFSISSEIWDELNESVRAELVKLGYKVSK